MAQSSIPAVSRAISSGPAPSEPTKHAARRRPQLSAKQEQLYRGLEGNNAFSAQAFAKGFAPSAGLRRLMDVRLIW